MTIRDGDEFRALAREIIDASGDPDPSVVAEKLLGQLSAADCKIALCVTLTDWLRTFRAQHDRAVMARGVVTGSRSVGPSKVRHVRDWVAAVLAQSKFTGDEWKRLGECDESDLRGMATVRRDQAARNAAEADRWESLADAMAEHRWATVAKVPPAELERLLGGAS